MNVPQNTYLDYQRLKQYFSENVAEEFIYHPNPGNAGDALIYVATVQFFEDIGANYRLYQPGMDVSGRIFVYGGGGNLNSIYHDAAIVIAGVLDQVKHLIILPHTINGHEELLSRMKPDCVTIFCREKTSYDYVSGVCAARVLLADDMAIHLRVSDFLARCGSDYKYCYYKNLKRKIKLLLYYARCTKHLFSKKLDAFRGDIESRDGRLPSCNIDLSQLFSPENMSLDKARDSVCQLVKFVQKFEQVDTDRLHSMIICDLLGIKVNFYPGSYYKNKAVYLFSQDKFKSVDFISND